MEGSWPAFPGETPYMYKDNSLEEEDEEHYRPGGYHEIDRGDLLKDGRYEILLKWGTSTDATIWVARDKQLEKWVTIKVKTAERSKYSRELDILLDLQRQSAGSEPEYFVPVLDNFSINGPNGHHQALVFEMLGPPAYIEILRAGGANERLDFGEIFEFSTAFLQSLDYVHRAGHAHRDLNLKSLVYTSKSLSHLSKEDLLKQLGDPRWPADVLGKRGIREEEATLEEKMAVIEEERDGVILSATWEDWDCPDEYALKLFGFESLFAAEIGDYGQYIGLEIPKMIPLHPDAHHKVDLWAAGILIYLMIFLESPCQLLGRPLQLWQDCGSLDAPEIPWNWVGRGINLYRDECPCFLLDRNPQSFPPHWTLVMRTDIHDPQLFLVLGAMYGLLQAKPDLRLSAKEALDIIETDGQTLERSLDN